MGKFFKTALLTLAAVVGFNVASGTVQQTHADELQTIQAQHKSGYLGTPQGWFWFENGQKYTGFRYYMGTYYWFINGVRQDSGWRHAWDMTYYTDNQGRAVQGNRVIDGVSYYFGDNGTFFLRGKASGYMDAGQGWLWYEGGQRFTGFRNYMGAYYWFQNGKRQQNKWENAWGMTYYVGADGRTVQGYQTIGGKSYYFGDNGTFFQRPAPTAPVAPAAHGQIKGSVDHIYHVPGGRYYNRTKNVVQWFWTEQDARNAGYRPSEY